MFTNMIAYQLLARLTHLTLWGQDEDGELEFVGTNDQWKKVAEFESKYES